MAGIAGTHSAAAAAALADSMAALSLGRPGSCSLTFRERMDAEAAAFLGALPLLLRKMMKDRRQAERLVRH